jgi:uncharacterized protein (TIGR03067 family)
MLKKYIVPLSAILLLGADSPADSAKKDLERMQGRWSVQQAQRDGKDAPATVRDGMTVKIDGNKLVISEAENAREETAEMTLDPGKSPATVDFKLLRPGDNENAFGIYKIDGDTLSICWTKHDGARPEQFETKAGTGQVLFVLKRAVKK